MTSGAAAGAPARRIVVGIGEAAVSDRTGDVIVTHALGSCVAVCLWDPVAQVAGLLHFLLPESRINPERARVQPAAFADTGLPLLFQTAYGLGMQKKHAIVRLVGGAEIAGDHLAGSLRVGPRNVQVARQLLWKNGLLIRDEAVGGRTPRTVALSVEDGRLHVSSGREALAVW